MGQYSLGEALNLLFEKSQWKGKVTELRLREHWEEIVGKTIARYTRNISLHKGVLTVHTDIAPLKQELVLGKEALIARINAFLEEPAVQDVSVK